MSAEIQTNSIPEEQAQLPTPIEIEEVPTVLANKSVSFGGSAPEFDADKLKRQSISWLEEYFEIQEEEEVEACISDASVPPEHLHTFISAAFNLITQQKRADLIARLFVYLHKQTILSIPAFRAALEELSQTIEDSTEELPNFPRFVGQVLGKLIVNNILDFSLLKLIASDELISSRIPLRLYGATFDFIDAELVYFSFIYFIRLKGKMI